MFAIHNYSYQADNLEVKGFKVYFFMIITHFQL